MDEELRQRWSDLLRPLFPAGADFRPQPHNEEYRATVSWRLETNANRPNKRSKTIVILVPSEVVDDYRNKPPIQQTEDDRKLTDFVTQQLGQLEPDHDNPGEVSPPEVQWIAGSNVLNT